MAITDYKGIFEKYESDELLKKRALGNELDPEAHRAIEEIFSERREVLPPIPAQPIAFEAKKSNKLVAIGMGLCFLILGEMLKQGVGLFLMVGFVLLELYKWRKQSSLTEEEKKAAVEQNKANSEGLNELMVSAAKGDLSRVKELLAYKAIDVNQKSLNGATALMFAAKNNHKGIVEALLKNEADVDLISDKKSTAISIAQKFGHTEIAELLVNHSHSKTQS